MNNNNGKDCENNFWSIFRNSFIRKLIFEKIKTIQPMKYGVFQYDQIIEVEWLLNFNYEYLLWCKVIEGSYLVFKSSILKELKKKCLFSYFKNDKNFYSKLLKNYPNYFKPTEKNSSFLEKTAVEFDNVALIQILVEEYNHQFTYSIIESSIEIGSYEVASYLLSIKENEIRSYKIINLFTKTMLNPLDEDLSKSMDFFINKLKIQQMNPLLLSCGRFFNFQIYRQPLKLILDCCYSIVYLKSYIQEYINNFETDIENVTLIRNELNGEDSTMVEQLLSEKYQLLTVEELNEIKLKFSNENNDLKLEIYKFPSTDEMIKKLYNMLIIFNRKKGEKCMFESFLFYKSKYTNQSFISPTSSPLLFKSYRFGIFKKDDLILKNGEVSCFNHKCSKNIQFKIFEYCPKEEQKQIDFLKAVCDYSKNEITDKYQKYLINTQTILYCINIDNFNYLQLVVNLLIGNGNCGNLYRFFNVFDVNKISIKIQSSEVFDLLYKKFPIKQRVNDKKETITIDLQIQQLFHKFLKYQPHLAFHFKNNYPNEYQMCISNSLVNLSYIIYGIDTVKLLNSSKFIFSNWKDFTDYHTDRQTDAIINDIWNNLPLDLSIEDFIWLVENTFKKTKSKFSYLTPTLPKMNQLKQIHYLLNNRPDYINNSRYKSEIVDVLICIYQFGNSNDRNHYHQQKKIIIDTLIKRHGLNLVIYSLIDYIIKRGEIEIIKHLLSHLYIPGSRMTSISLGIMAEIRKFFLVSVYHGNLDILKYLTKNFIWAFGDCDRELFQLFVVAIDNTNLEIVDFMVNEFKDLICNAIKNGFTIPNNVYIKNNVVYNNSFLLKEFKINFLIDFIK
ncbi:hypothetical protein RB653_005206 [Dictyostelium firmibasis]|uniref:Uncharacterized protein n=1 Tax=Dictyostelium firmibasis TaxID=79012 RepID=A0AAN7UKM8_9MYCE